MAANTNVLPLAQPVDLFPWRPARLDTGSLHRRGALGEDGPPPTPGGFHTA